MACCLPSGTNRAVPYMLYNMCLESEKASLANKHLTPMPTPDRHLTPMPSPERATCRSNLTQERRIVASGLFGARRHERRIVASCWARDATSPSTFFWSVTLSVKMQLYVCMLQIECERYISIEKDSGHKVGEDKQREEQQGTEKQAEKTE
mmetsp:Transcript_42169/g.67794  ORF Transcript_42169/g.67794 Transcript_42169/m.67794 type:complete len:151 (-) Transcript_42169:88-540(-)